MAKKRRLNNPADALKWMKAIDKLKNRKLGMKLAGVKVERQRRIPGLRRFVKQFGFHPALLLELERQAVAEGVSPQLWLVRRLAENWGFDRKDV